MKNCRKKWGKPELTVLVRSNPEESVLLACKAGGGAGPGIGKCNQGEDGKEIHCNDLAQS